MDKGIKLFVTDMDGTLLNSEHKISEENLEALKELKETGTEIMVATGRVDTMVKAYIRQLGLKAPVISCNGGLIRNILTKETLYINEINKDSILKVLQISKKYKVPYLIYGEHNVYADEITPRVKFFQKYNKTLSNEDRVPIVIVDDINEVINNEERLIKVLIICEDDNVIKLMGEELSEIEDIVAYKSAKNLFDIMSKGVSKGSAIKHYAKFKGIMHSEVAAIGDNHNDISMLEVAGLSIAVENAEEIVKSKADYITKNNNDHGVAHAIREYLL